MSVDRRMADVWLCEGLGMTAPTMHVESTFPVGARAVGHRQGFDLVVYASAQIDPEADVIAPTAAEP